MCLLWLYSVFCDTKDTFILHPPPDSWQVFLHTINIFLLLFYIYKTALLPGVLRRSESCCHKSPLPTLSLRTCLVGIFICKRPGSARFEALHEKTGNHATCGFAQETARAYSMQDPHVSGSTGAPASWPRPVGWYYNWNPLLSDGIMKRNALIHVHQEENIRWREKR